MPDHVHGIIEIKKDTIREFEKNKFGPQSMNLASIVRGYKVGVTKHARKINPDFKWQPRYHNHIIQDNRAFKNISRYIENNPRDWGKKKEKRSKL